MKNKHILPDLPVFPVNESLYRTFCENTSDPIVIFDRDYHLVYLNPAFTQLTGCSIEELAGHLPPFPYQIRQDPGNNQYLTPDGQPRVILQEWKKQDGLIIQVETTPVPIKVGGALKYFVCLWKEITERNKLEASLRISEEKLSKLLNAIPIPIAISTLPSGIIEYANDRFLKTSGFNRDEIIGHSGNSLQWENPAARDQASKTLIENGRFEDVEINLINKSGEMRTSLLSAEIVTFEDKNFMLSASLDITDRKRAVDALKESEAFNAGLLTDAPNPILVLNRDASVRYVNPALERLTGFSSSELIGKKAPYPWWPSEMHNNYQKGNSEKPMLDTDVFERAYLKKNGEYIWCAITVRNVKQEGRIKYHILNWVDITSRKNAEDALRESETFNASLLNEAPNPILVLNADGSIRYANPALEKLTGFSSDEIKGVPPFPWWPQELHNKYLTDFGATRDSNSEHFEMRYSKKNGEIFWCAVNTRHIKENGRDKYHIINWVDITERKIIEDALKETEVFNSRLLNNAPNPILLADENGKIRYVNPALEKLTGYSASEIFGTQPPYPWWPQEKHELYRGEKARTIGEVDNFSERMFRKKSGEVFWVGITLQSINEKGKNKYLLANWMDITERKKMEDQIVELYLKEKQQREELQEEAKARGLFIHVLAHELRTPVTPILVSIGMLKDRFDQNPDKVQNKLVDNIFRSTNVLALRLEELLELGRYSRGKTKLQIKTMDFRVFVEEMVSKYSTLLDQKNQQLSLKIPAGLPSVVADPSKVEQVLINLISNLSKFSPDGSTLELWVKSQENTLVVSVKEGNTIISSEDQEKLFKPYHMVEQDRQLFPGLGLGLALTRYIIEAHGGKIWINSEEGRGTTFSFSLPLKSDNPAKTETMA